MPLSTSLTAYPPSMFAALDTALSLGEFIIPCSNPRAMRLQFQGLRGALRKNHQSERADLVGFYLGENPPSLIIRLKDHSLISKEIQAALSTPPVASPLPSRLADDAEAAMARILGAC